MLTISTIGRRIHEQRKGTTFVLKTGISNNEDCSELIARSGVTKTKSRPANHKGHDVEVDPMPSWFQPKEHQVLAENELIMTSFKWNVHNHGRTMNLKWLESEPTDADRARPRQRTAVVS